MGCKYGDIGFLTVLSRSQFSDAIAKRRRVFKVETVGDCYVAACGLPDPRKDHAGKCDLDESNMLQFLTMLLSYLFRRPFVHCIVAMARFARDCMVKTNELTRALECTLGPDTADLAMRIGLHSGPVTAGVLRGDNARFQLFGDTVSLLCGVYWRLPIMC